MLEIQVLLCSINFYTKDVGRGFKPRSSQTKDYENGICCFSAKNTELRSKSKD
jgi:hypothetical protein